MNTVLNRTYRVEFVKIVAVTGTPERLTARTITSIVRSGTTPRCVVTITGHGFTAGAILHISGATEPEFNVMTRVAGVINDDSFYILVPGVTPASTGAPVCYADIWVRQATVLGRRAPRTPNVGFIYLGTKAGDSLQPQELAANGETSLTAGKEGVGPMVNLADFYVDVATPADGVFVSYF